MSTVLITGGAGFIGSHLVDRMLKDGYKVVVVDDLSTGNSNYISRDISFSQLDIADRRLGEIFSHNEISYVFHLAAQTDVPRSVNFPVKDAAANVLGTVNLLEKCQAFKVRKIIYLSGGAAVYGEGGGQPFTETSPLQPISPIGLSKMVGERYIELASRVSGLSYTVLRCANVFGPRQDHYREVGVVAGFCQYLVNDKAPAIYGDGAQTRDFLYIDDLIEALCQGLIEGDREIINVGSGKSTSILEVFSLIKKLTGFSGEPYYRPAQPGGVGVFSMKVEKARQVLKWQEKTSLEDGLSQTIEYYRRQNVQT